MNKLLLFLFLLFHLNAWTQPACGTAAADPSFTVSQAPTLNCQGGQILTCEAVFKTSIADMTYDFWDFGGNTGGSGTGMCFTRTFLECKTYTITHTVQCINSNGVQQFNSTSADVTINIPVVAITATVADQPGTSCGRKIITYNICPSNCGSGMPMVPPDNMNFVLTVPPGLNLVGGNFSTSSGTPTISIPGGTFTSCQTYTAIFEAVPCAGPGPFTVALNPMSTCVEFQPKKLSNTVVFNEPKLNISKTTTATSVMPGDNITYTVTVSNTGTATANNVSIKDVFPTGMVLITGPAGSTVMGNMVLWNEATIGTGQSKTYTLTFKVLDACAGSFTNCAEANFPGCCTVPVSSCNTITLNASNFAVVNVVGNMSVSGNGLPKPVGLPVSGSTVPVIMNFAANSTLLIDPASFVYQFPSGTIFRMSDGSAITLIGSKILDLRNSIMSSCDRLWDGITVQGNGILKMDGTTIKDAKYAVYVPTSGKLIIRNSTFDMNYIGIHAPSPATHLLSTWTLENNQFTCSNPLIPNSTINFGTVPIADGLAYAGIDAANGDLLTIGSPNTFSNMSYGIRLASANANISQCRFFNIRTGVYTHPFGGAGIYFTSSSGLVNSLFQRGLGKTLSNPTFDNCDLGIYTQYANTDVAENGMANMVQGIYTRTPTNRDYNVINNEIACSDQGIYIYSTPLKFVMTGNHVVLTPNLTSTRRRGICAQNVTRTKPPSSSLDTDGHIFNNDVNHSGNSTGIFLGTCRYLDVMENKVFPNAPSSGICYGIRSQAGLGNYITYNEVTCSGSALSNPDCVGILEDISPEISLCCNTITDAYSNIRINGTCNSKDKITANNIHSGHYGLDYLENGTTLVQRTRGNQWLGGSYDKMAIHRGGNEPAIYSTYTVAKLELPFWPPSNLVEPTQDWFTSSSSGIDYKCTGAKRCIPFQASSGENIKEEEILVTNGVNMVNHTQGSEWQSKWQLLDRIVDVPSVYASSNILQNFRANIEQQAQGRLYAVQQGILGAQVLGISEQEQLAEYYTSIYTAIRQIAVVDVALSLENPTNLAALTSQKQEILAAMALSVQEANTILAAQGNSQSNILTTLLAQNAAINPLGHPCDMNQQVTNAGFAQLCTGVLTENSTSSIAALQNVAAQCPLDGGSAVYEARTILSGLGIEQEYNDAVVCATNIAPPIEGRNAKPTETVFTLSVVPVPFTDQITVYFSDPNIANAQLRVFNMVGQLITEQPFYGGGAQSIVTQQWPRGVYLVVLENTFGKNIAQQKIIK
jgi:uncharacterized repeat protein (TIGR01451 family)